MATVQEVKGVSVLNVMFNEGSPIERTKQQTVNSDRKEAAGTQPRAGYRQ